jgi:acetylornithine deacetylase/succinyl-diaminopimelate desuccinylase-like protein
MSLDPVQTLQELIRIPSVNSMGREVAGPHFGEERLTSYLQALCEKQGWAWLRQEVHPGRENLLALIPGNPSAADGGELILWDVHQDTVSAEGMTVDAFAGGHRDGRIHGRGACDVKGSMAAMIVALSQLKLSKPPRTQPTIAIAFTVNEECGFTGARALCELWPQADGSRRTTTEVQITSGNVGPDAAFPKRPDCAIVAEPTDLNVVVAHQGVVRWRCHVEGRAAHSSRPDEGVNAIYAMTRVVQAIEQYHRELAASAREHPLCGRPSVCVSTIHGGVGINTVPDRATIEIDRRVSPGEDPAAAYSDLISYVATHADIGPGHVIHDPPFMKSAGLSDATNRLLAERLAGIVRRDWHSSQLLGVPYGTDAAAISTAGVPTVVFGPGSIRQAHTADEFMATAELQIATQIFQRIAEAGLT